MSTIQPRLRASARFTGALWGAIVTAIGATTIAVFSGADIDLELLVIVVLAAAGAWLLLSAVAVGFADRKRASTKRRSTADNADPAASPGATTG
jgi:hypothetical protein